jgi:hypothetical protein
VADIHWAHQAGHPFYQHVNALLDRRDLMSLPTCLSTFESGNDRLPNARNSCGSCTPNWYRALAPGSGASPLQTFYEENVSNLSATHTSVVTALRLPPSLHFDV